MKLQDLNEHDHPERFYVWTKTELDFINARVRTAYEMGLKDNPHAAITDAAAIREAFEKDCG